MALLIGSAKDLDSEVIERSTLGTPLHPCRIVTNLPSYEDLLCEVPRKRVLFVSLVKHSQPLSSRTVGERSKSSRSLLQKSIRNH